MLCNFSNNECAPLIVDSSMDEPAICVAPCVRKEKTWKESCSAAYAVVGTDFLVSIAFISSG